MPGDAAGAEQEAEDALLADAERVEAPAAELERDAAALVERRSRSAPCRGARGTATGRPAAAPISSSAVITTSSSPLARAPALAAERRGRGHLGGDLALHVLRAAAANLAVDDVARPGVEAPLGGVGRDRVDVAEQAERRSRRRRRAAARPGSGGPGSAAEQLALEPAPRSGVSASSSWAGSSLPGGLTVSIRISSCSSVDRPATARGLGPAGAAVSSSIPDRRLPRRIGSTRRRSRGRPRPIGLTHDERAHRERHTGGCDGESATDASGCSTRARRRPANRRSAGGGAAAVRMRPRSLDELVGQEHLLGRGLGAAHRDRDRRAALGDPLRAAGLRARRPWRGSSPPRAAGPSRRSRRSTPAGPRSGR